MLKNIVITKLMNLLIIYMDKEIILIKILLNFMLN